MAQAHGGHFLKEILKEPTGYFGGYFKKYPPLTHWVKGGQIVSEPTMYLAWTHWVIDPLLPVLPAGRKNQIIQHMLPTHHIDQSTYKGNDQVIAQTWKELGLSLVEEMKKTGLECVVVWAGDQLTISWLCGLVSYCSHDDNSFERMVYLILMFGWFHLQMAFTTSLHTQYYGTKATFRFLHTFDIMKKKGLSSTATQGMFHHTFEEVLKEVAIACF